MRRRSEPILLMNRWAKYQYCKYQYNQVYWGNMSIKTPKHVFRIPFNILWPTAIPEKHFDTNTFTFRTKSVLENFTAVSKRNMVRQRIFSLLERRCWQLASGGCARRGECQLPRTKKHPHYTRAWCVRKTPPTRHYHVKTREMHSIHGGMKMFGGGKCWVL